jgi:hypothetical protein
MRLDKLIYLAAIAALFVGAYHASADPVDARAVIRQTRDEEPDTAAMQRHVARSEPAVVLALTAWLEAGALVSAGEVAAIHEVITTRMRGSYQRTAWQYSAGLRHPRHERSHAMGRAPLGAGWPRSHREHWPRVLAAADAAIAGTLHHGCSTGGARLEHWGGTDLDRANINRLLRQNYSEAVCDGFANAFLYRGAP